MRDPKPFKIFFLGCVVLGLFVGLASAVDVDMGPEFIRIDLNQAEKFVEKFSHHKHQEMENINGDCTKCHHKTKEGEKPKKCGSCHTDVKKKDPKTKAIGFKMAFHKQCLGCHEKQKDKPKLKKCKTCHPIRVW